MPAKVRSPNYPIISLADAVARIRTVFDAENRHPAEREVIARALGYSGLNGKSMGIISALAKYGLLESIGDQARVSPLALEIILHEPGSPERRSAARQAAFTPGLFNELHGLYGDRLPSDHNLRAYLVKKGFNPNTVDGVIRSYRDTLAFVQAEDGAVEEFDATPTCEEPAPAMQATDYAADTRPRFQPTTFEQRADEARDGLVLSFKIAEDTEVRSAFKGNVTQEAIRKFIQLLEVSLDTFPPKEKVAKEPGSSAGE